jgi:hypothetical protein
VAARVRRPGQHRRQIVEVNGLRREVIGIMPPART